MNACDFASSAERQKIPYPWQLGKFNRLEEQIAKVEKIIELVVPIPRLVFDSGMVHRAVIQCLQGPVEAAEGVSNADLYKVLHERYASSLEKQPASASLRLFLLNMKRMNHRGWDESADQLHFLRITPVAILLYRD